MEKRSKESVKSEANCVVNSLISEDIEIQRNGEVTSSNFKVDSSDENGRKANGIMVSGGNDKHDRTVQNKQVRSDLGKELVPTNSSREVRGRSKLPPFRVGRYIPSDGYLYSSSNFGITDETCCGNGKDVEFKSGIHRVKIDRFEAQGKDTRMQSASFHGLETKRARSKLRTRCRSTDCGRVTGQDAIRLNNKISNYGCMRELGNATKSRVKCHSADLSALSIQDELNCHKIGSTPSKNRPNKQFYVNKESDNELSDQALTGVDEAELSNSSVTSNKSHSQDAGVSLQKDMSNEKVSSQRSEKATDGEGIKSGSRMSDSSTKSTLDSKKRNCLEKTLSSTENSPTRKGKKKENIHEFGSCLSKQDSKDKALSRKDKFNTESSPKRNIKSVEKSDSKSDSLQKTREGKGTNETDSNVNNPIVRRNLSNNELDKSGTETCKVETSSRRNSTKNEDVSVFPSRNEQTSPKKDSTGKSKSTSKASPQKNGKKKVNANVSHSPSRNVRNNTDKAENMCSKPASSEKVDVRNFSKICVDVSQVDSTQICTEIKSDQVMKTDDCKTQEKENADENKSKKVEATADVENEVENTSGTVFGCVNMKANGSDDIGNHSVSSSQSSEALMTVIHNQTSSNSDEVLTAIHSRTSSKSNETLTTIHNQTSSNSDEVLTMIHNQTSSNSDEALSAIHSRTSSNSDEALKVIHNQTSSNSDEALTMIHNQTSSNSDEALSAIHSRTSSNSDEAVTMIHNQTSSKSDEDIKTCDTKDVSNDRLRGNVKLRRNYRTKVTKRPNSENRSAENNQHSYVNQNLSEKDGRSSLNKNPSETGQVPNLNKNPEGKRYSSGRRLSGGVNKYQYEKKTVDEKSTESSRKRAFERRESYSKQLREKNMRNVELKKKVGIVNKRNGVRLQEDSAITVKIKHVKSRRLLRRNVDYVKREQKVHFSEEHDHDNWVLFTVTLNSSLLGHASHEGLDLPDGRNSPEFCRSSQALLCCVLPKCGNVIPKVKNVLVRSPKSNLKRLSLLPVKKLRWSLFDGMVMFFVCCGCRVVIVKGTVQPFE